MTALLEYIIPNLVNADCSIRVYHLFILMVVSIVVCGLFVTVLLEYIKSSVNRHGTNY